MDHNGDPVLRGLSQAVNDGAVTNESITLLFGDKIVTGVLVSRDAWLKSISGEDADFISGIPDDPLVMGADEIAEKATDTLPVTLHLDNVTMLAGQTRTNLKGGILRVYIPSVTGFMVGSARRDGNGNS